MAVWSRGQVATTSMGPLVVLAPHALQDFESTDIVEEAALSLNLNAALSYHGSLSSLDTLGAKDEKRPE